MRLKLQGLNHKILEFVVMTVSIRVHNYINYKFTH